MSNEIVIDNFDLSNAYKFCDYLMSYSTGNLKDDVYIKVFAYYVAQCKNSHENKLIVGMTKEHCDYLSALLNNLDKTLMAEVEKAVQGDWNQVLIELGVIK